MKMLKYTMCVALAAIVISFLGCQKNFLQKPIGTDLNVDSIFSTKQKAMSAIAKAYGNSLTAGVAISSTSREWGMQGGTLGHLSGEINATKFNWEDGWKIQRGGMVSDDGSGSARTDDNFGFNYKAIRQNNAVINNIDKVPDMSEQEKAQVNAEMKLLSAYRYQEMFKRYGGVPLVKEILTADMDVKIPRASLQETLDYIIGLCDEAYTVLPDSYPANMEGRLTKGVALAIKAEALLYAARPLFNNGTPYMSLGSNNKLICFGAYDKQRWQAAVDASLAVIQWAEANGYRIISTGSPFDDYGTAVSTPGNKEVLLAFKLQDGYAQQNYSPNSQGGGANGMSFYQLRQYVKADGTEQAWPAEGEQRTYTDYVTRIEAMEPRYKASAMGAGIDAWNNPGDTYWSSLNVSGRSNWEGKTGYEACGRRVKFWYKASTRNWFNFPLYRLAEFYLNVAEAYNELDRPAEALTRLNVIRRRAGLPNVTETDKDKLRKIIQREWAVEFYEEMHRLYDVKHWKLDNIGNGIIGGPKQAFAFTNPSGEARVAADYTGYTVKKMYDGFWAQSQYLSPFPKAEINKEYIIQNPGY